jgi:hypothetical protein
MRKFRREVAPDRAAGLASGADQPFPRANAGRSGPMTQATPVRYLEVLRVSTDTGTLPAEDYSELLLASARKKMEELHMHWRAGLPLSGRTRIRRAGIDVAAVPTVAPTGGVLSSVRCRTLNADQSGRQPVEDRTGCCPAAGSPPLPR